MPLGDRTGPMGMGPMTGRGAGYCGGFGSPGYTNPGMGRGMGMGRGGGGRGWRNGFYATGRRGWMPFGGGFASSWNADPATEKQSLQTQADFLRRQLETLEKRLSEINDGDKEE